MLAFFTNLNFTELGIIAIGAVMVFGKDLPQVVMRGLQQLAKLRKAVMEMWRDAGLEQEFKRVRAELDSEVSELSAAKKALADGKNLLNGPVAHWRQNIGIEVDDAVAVGKPEPRSHKEAQGPDQALTEEAFDPEEPDPMQDSVQESKPEEDPGSAKGS